LGFKPRPARNLSLSPQKNDRSGRGQGLLNSRF
jgi:hypothetical protein